MAGSTAWSLVSTNAFFADAQVLFLDEILARSKLACYTFITCMIALARWCRRRAALAQRRWASPLGQAAALALRGKRSP